MLLAESGWGEFLLVLWYTVPISLLITAASVWYDVLQAKRRDDLWAAHRIEMQRSDKMIEMHKAGIRVSLEAPPPEAPPPAAPEPAPEPEKEVASAEPPT